MKEDTNDVWNKIKKAIEEKDKIAFSNYMVALDIKGRRDIADL